MWLNSGERRAVEGMWQYRFKMCPLAMRGVKVTATLEYHIIGYANCVLPAGHELDAKTKRIFMSNSVPVPPAIDLAGGQRPVLHPAMDCSSELSRDRLRAAIVDRRARCSCLAAIDDFAEVAAAARRGRSKAQPDKVRDALVARLLARRPCAYRIRCSRCGAGQHELRAVLDGASFPGDGAAQRRRHGLCVIDDRGHILRITTWSAERESATSGEKPVWS